MKKFFLFAAAALAAMTINAQQVWDVSEFETQKGFTSGDNVVNGLGFYAISEEKDPFASGKEFGGIDEKEKTWKQSEGFPETFKGYKRIKTNGGASATDGMPSQRYLHFDVSGPSVVQVWYTSGGSGSRYAIISDGSNETKSEEMTASSDFGLLTANIAQAGTVYIYGTSSIYVWKIAATPASGEGIDELLVAPKANKVVYNGQVVIVKEGRMFNLLGAEVLK